MQECFKCGVSGERELLFDAISGKGVVKVCRNCAEEEGLPLVSGAYEDRPERTKSVYERLSSMARLDPEKHRRMIKEREEVVKRQRQDKTLKDIVDENFSKKTYLKSKPREDLIENFHWILMRVRRARKLTQKQLAEDIGETEAVIKMAEEGFIPENSDTLVKKLENYFTIRLFREDNPYPLTFPAFSKVGIREDPAKQKIREKLEKEGDFDSKEVESLTISDLQEIKRKKESEGKGIFSFLRKNKKEKTENSESKEELSDEEANEILFGK